MIKINLNHMKNLSLGLLLGIVLLSSCKKDKSTDNTTPETPVHPITAQSKAYVSQLFDFNPAPGQFDNTGIGDTVAAKSTLNGDQGLVSLGAWGYHLLLPTIFSCPRY